MSGTFIFARYKNRHLLLHEETKFFTLMRVGEHQNFQIPFASAAIFC